MFDLFCVVLLLLFFVVAVGYTRAWERLEREDD